MEIERKYLLDQLPENLTSYPCKKIEQGYLSTEPVVRIRRSDDEYYLTYKSKGLMVREEYNLPLTKESYLHLREKADGVLISKTKEHPPDIKKKEKPGIKKCTFSDIGRNNRSHLSLSCLGQSNFSQCLIQHTQRTMHR